LQRPLPSHTLPPLTVPAAWFWQTPAPLHVPSSPQVAASDFGHSPGARGASPRATNEQVPIAPGSAHDLHVSVQAALQQTPSAQKPLAHSPAHPHAWPLVFFAASALTQAAPGPASPWSFFLGDELHETAAIARLNVTMKSSRRERR
jgi:hypothetical protein